MGAGIVGMATAREVMLRHPHLKCSVIDKESIVGKSWSYIGTGRHYVSFIGLL